MATDLSRRDFLRGASSASDPLAMRPPGVQQVVFEKLCRDCSACSAACPEQIITFDSQARPVLDLSKAHCTFCGACADVCPTGALMPDAVTNWPWRAQVQDSCLSMTGVACRMCQDSCEASAIRFKLETKGCATPVIDLQSCTGCGACSSVCPTRSIAFFELAGQRMEDTV